MVGLTCSSAETMPVFAVAHFACWTMDSWVGDVVVDAKGVEIFIMLSLVRETILSWSGEAIR